MQVHLKVHGRDLPPSLKMLIEQHFRFAVYPYRSAIDSVDVQLMVPLKTSSLPGA